MSPLSLSESFTVVDRVYIHLAAMIPATLYPLYALREPSVLTRGVDVELFWLLVRSVSRIKIISAHRLQIGKSWPVQ